MQRILYDPLLANWSASILQKSIFLTYVFRYGRVMYTQGRVAVCCFWERLFLFNTVEVVDLSARNLTRRNKTALFTVSRVENIGRSITFISEKVKLLLNARSRYVDHYEAHNLIILWFFQILHSMLKNLGVFLLSKYVGLWSPLVLLNGKECSSCVTRPRPVFQSY